MEPITVAVINRKGGVGKTSTCQHLSGTLPEQGLSVLLVDMDPQASLTQGFLGPQATEQLEYSQTAASLFDDRFDPSPEDLIIPTQFAGISLLPAGEHLDQFNIPSPAGAGPLQFALRDFLKDTRQAFDVTLIDCPPNLHLCSWNSLVAADCVIVPVQAEDYGAQGITHVQKAIDLALERHNPRLRLLGYLVTMFTRRLGIHFVYERQLRRLYGPQVFSATVPMMKDFKEAIAARKPVSVYRPRSAAAVAISKVANEMLERAERLRESPPAFLYLGNHAAQAELKGAV